MSLVQAILTNDFIIMGADTRAIHTNKDTVDNHNKMIRLNDSIVFGCTGGMDANYKLFLNYCEYSDTEGLIPSNISHNISYNDFVNIISVRFLKMYALKHRPNNPIPFEIMSMICGYNGKCFEATIFNIDDTINPIVKKVPPMNFPYKGVNAGRPVVVKHFCNTTT